MADDVKVHPSGLCESDRVGRGSRIWAFAHVMKGAVVGEECNIGDHAFVEGGAVLGNGVTVKNGVAVWEGVTLEDYVFVGPNAVFTNDRFPRSPRGPEAKARYASHDWLSPTRVRQGATIGANATVVCGITIGRYAMIGAAAVVTRDVGDFELVIGCPARPIGHVCVCSARLPAGEAPKCPACSRAYRKTGRALEPLFEIRGF
jgi:UDP-2-acetamido-3-amino-2,3-dideoxy-glucuronate N-acetyltransferase